MLLKKKGRTGKEFPHNWALFLATKIGRDWV